MVCVFALCGYVATIVETPYLIAAIIAYGMRYVLKGITLWYYEDNLSPSYAMSLMLGTQQFRSGRTLFAFQVAGVLQWVAFYVLFEGLSVSRMHH